MTLLTAVGNQWSAQVKLGSKAKSANVAKSQMSQGMFIGNLKLKSLNEAYNLHFL